MSIGTFRLRIGLLDEVSHEDILAHNLHEPKLDPRLAPDRLAGNTSARPWRGRGAEPPRGLRASAARMPHPP